MSSPTISWRALLALVYFLGGIVVFVLGVALVIAGLADIVAGGLWLSHGSAGIVYGLPLSLLGFWAARRGKQTYRAIESAAIVR